MADTGNPLALVPEESLSSANVNGVNGQSSANSAHPSTTTPQGIKLDPNFTQSVLNATGSKASPRVRQVVHSLIQHIHDFARENKLTVDEWMAGVEMVHLLPDPTSRPLPPG